MQPARSAALLAAVAVVVLASAASCRGQLANNYYAGKCGNASVETIIRDAVKARLVWDNRMVAGLLHLQFHDCFVAVRTRHCLLLLLLLESCRRHQ
jgi:peroxidase